jgi:hypothetical protein
MAVVDMPEPEFEVPQFYETAIAMRYVADELDREFRFLCLPASAIHDDNGHLLDDPAALLSQVLELGESLPLRVAQLPDAIFTLLRLEMLGEEAHGDTVLDLVSSAEWLDGQREEDPDAALFAEYLAFAEVVPFEQSKAKVSPLVATAMGSYTLASGIVKVSPGAVILGPHGPVAFVAVAGAVAVIDSVGVIVGVVTSPVTGQVVNAVRRGFRRLIHRAPPGERTATPETPEPPETPEQAEERARQLEAELEAKRVAALAAQRRETLEKQARLNEIARAQKRKGLVPTKPPADLGD